MLAHFGLLREEPCGGTRQRVLPEAEAQGLANKALVCRERVNSIHGYNLLTKYPTSGKTATTRTKKKTKGVPFSHSPRDREVWTAWVSKLQLRLRP